ncbi:MAG: cytochrome c [Armatimonadota bacterium]|nr:cytochrome c [Armatimonadota bacterium]
MRTVRHTAGVVCGASLLMIVLALIGAALPVSSVGAPNGEPPGPPPGSRNDARGPGGTAVAVAGSFIFVVQGNTLYQFALDDLRLIRQVSLNQGQGQTAGGAATPTDQGSQSNAGQNNTTLLAEGRAVLDTYRCANCHALTAEGRGRAPNLSRVGAEHTAEWIVAHVKNPRIHNPGSRMPAFEGRINDKDLQALGAYLASLK